MILHGIILQGMILHGMILHGMILYGMIRIVFVIISDRLYSCEDIRP